MTTGFDGPTKLPRPFGPFTLVRLIAQGGMGQVYLALRPVEGESTDEVCVVKTVRADLKNDREAIGRFLDEARVAQKLDHPAICHTLDAGVTEKTYFLALEFISGRNLRDVQTRAQKLNKALPDELIFHTISDTLVALDYAHKLKDRDSARPLNIVHRDVSPHNVMLGFDGNVKLIDFGLATHVLKREFTRPGIMVGKLRYNAPEQVRDRAMDGRSDLYSVGVMLYEALTGERFYEGLAEEAVWRVAMEGNHRPPSWTKLPRDAQRVLDLALSGEPEDRYPSASHMRDAVLELARSRDVRDGRKESARFMADVFADERLAERDMILQATGLAEARTRLFATEPIQVKPDADHSHSSVGRTAVVTPADIRGKLADLVSGFDPGALTALPERPSFMPGDDDDDGDTGAEPPETHPDIGEDSFRSSGHRTTAPSTRADAETVVRRAGFSPFGSEVSDTEAAPEHTTPGLPRNVSISGAQRPPPVVSTSGGRTISGQQRATRTIDGAAPRGDLPPLSGRTPNPTVIILSAAVVVLLVAIGAITWALIKKMQEEKPTVADAGATAVVDAGAKPALVITTDAGLVEPVPDASTLAATDAGFAQEPDAGFVDAVVDSVVDAGFTPRDGGGRVRIKKQPERVLDRPIEKGPPPQRDFRTLKEQVDYLKTYCLERVACAKTSVDKAATIAHLSPEETRTLIAEIPLCITRCQKAD